MPLIMPIKDLRNTNELSSLAHKSREPIFITKNGYSDLVVMSSELYDSFMRENSIDYAIYKAEKEFAETGETVEAKAAFDELEKKYFG
ncbi:type II toxin-antitoxin system Phd/YefM family antitoxin [Anaerovibrio sp.]|uniref:type II toxin-antitoxin system Phd/YefM family antitoxin n=1 Tax=Anaerovibrio sp. TaxID=1872532 RepID=UPI0025BCD514|nr:type II toxin-antitoxin system Phd/YefM family antitoxin [Anaerovibrio sp.]MBR2143181.1 type II toxin-antitoxin system Phd/YefM family antitoxin [Anaerovibrio sp.]